MTDDTTPEEPSHLRIQPTCPQEPEVDPQADSSTKPAPVIGVITELERWLLLARRGELRCIVLQGEATSIEGGKTVQCTRYGLAGHVDLMTAASMLEQHAFELRTELLSITHEAAPPEADETIEGWNITLSEGDAMRITCVDNRYMATINRSEVLKVMLYPPAEPGELRFPLATKTFPNTEESSDAERCVYAARWANRWIADGDRSSSPEEELGEGK